MGGSQEETMRFLVGILEIVIARAVIEPKDIDGRRRMRTHHGPCRILGTVPGKQTGGHAVNEVPACLEFRDGLEFDACLPIQSVLDRLVE